MKHWHGAAHDSAMTHIAVQEALEGKTVEWMELVGDEQYLQADVTGAEIAPASGSGATARKG